MRSVYVMFACLYALSLGRGFYSSDGEVMFKTTAALVEHGTLALAPDPGLPQIVAGQGGTFYGKYDPGLPLLGIPFYVTGDWVGRVNAAHRTRLAATFVLLLPALAAAGTVTALAWLACRLTARRSRVVLVALSAGLATPLWPYARVLFPEAILALALTLTVGAIHELPLRKTRVVLAGAVFGVGILTRAALAIYALPLAVLILRLDRRRLALFAAGSVPFVGLLLWHNNLRFGDPFQFGYGEEGFTTPVWEGVIGLLFSPGKSVFLYAPPLLLSVLLWPRFRRAYPALGEFLVLAWIVALLFYGTWWAWHGAWSWGPRLLVPLIPLSCLPLIVLPDGRVWRGSAGAALVGGIGVQMLGVLTDGTPHYAAVFERASSTADAYRRIAFVPRESPLVAAAQRLLHGQTEPLALFHLAGTGLPPTWTVGVPLLLSAGLIYSIWRRQ